MACACRNKNKTTDNNVSNDITVEPVAMPIVAQNSFTTVSGTSNSDNSTQDIELTLVNKDVTASDGRAHMKRIPYSTPSEMEAHEINLKQCYLCTKKHIGRAKEFFQEYHTGYPDHIKNLMMSTRIAENTIRKAFLLWQQAMSQLNMAEGELLGDRSNELKMREEHLSLANRIRTERLKLSDDPLYVPDFDQLLVDIHILQLRVLELM